MNWRVFLCCLRKGRKRSRKARAETDVILVLRGRLPCWDCVCVCGCMSVCRGVGAAVVSKPPITVFYDHFLLLFFVGVVPFSIFCPFIAFIFSFMFVSPWSLTISCILLCCNLARPLALQPLSLSTGSTLFPRFLILLPCFFPPPFPPSPFVTEIPPFPHTRIAPIE